MDIQDLIPKDKFDVETADKLKGYTYEEIKPIVPELLTWLQDCNWPVSRPVADYLEGIAEHLTGEIIQILRGDDAMWSYWCIGIFGYGTKDPVLKQEIERIALHPTAYEVREFIHERALDVRESYI